MALDSLTQKASSLVTDKLGSFLGIGGNDNYPLYNKFVTAILQDANNTIPEKSNWVGFFSFPPLPPPDSGGGKKQTLGQKLKNAATVDNLKKYITSNKGKNVTANHFFGGLFEKISKNDLEANKWNISDKGNLMASNFTTNGGNAVMFLTGVQLPGDGFAIERPSTNMNVGGFLKSPVTKPRNDLPHLKVTFIETNSSLVDLVIRPWVIHSSYASLKFANSATFDVFNLTRSPNGFRIRKQFTFYNVVPVSVDTEDYTYSADSSYGLRQTEFVYTHYSVSEGQNLIDSLLDKALNVAARTALNAATALVEGGVDIVAGGASRVLTNVSGAFTGAVRDVVVDTQSRLREFTKNAEDSVIDKSARLAEKVIGVNPKADHVNFNQVNSLSTDGSNNVTGAFSGLAANPDDNIRMSPLPISSTATVNNVTYTIRSNPSNDSVSSKGILSDEKSIDLNDTVIGNSIKYQEVSIDTNDTVDTSGLKTQQISINNNDHR
jgi:hypothetical protein